MYKHSKYSCLEGGYIVYRDHPGEMKCTEDDYIKAHKTAVFIYEEEAKVYCNIRNVMQEQYETDDIRVIKDFYTKVTKC